MTVESLQIVSTEGNGREKVAQLFSRRRDDIPIPNDLCTDPIKQRDLLSIRLSIGDHDKSRQRRVESGEHQGCNGMDR